MNFQHHKFDFFMYMSYIDDSNVSQDNLMKVLAVINAESGALEAERALDPPLMREIREEMKTPQPTLDRPLALHQQLE